MKIKLLLKYSLPLALTWALIILALCSIPGQYIPSVSLLELVSFDKWVHAGMFFVLCNLSFFHLLQKGSDIKRIYLFLIICVLYGCLLEVMQGTLFSNRSADWHDIVANTFGCLMALIFYRKIYKFLEKTK